MKKRLYLILIVLFASFSGVMAQVKVSGTVTDPDGVSIPGVSVVQKGTTNGTVTDANGKYAVSVSSASAVLQFSFVGMTPVSEALNGRSVINVKMVAESVGINEVVVTALGISKEAKKVGYAVSTVNSEQFNKARENNVALSLAGSVAGLNVHSDNGGPGSSARILLRGVSSLTGGGSPLFVINGVPMDNSQRGSAGEWGGSDNGDGIGNINPDDIENMTVLKGLAASALYGSRAANGVILVTTKTGKKGSAEVEFNSNFQSEKAIDYTDYQYVYGQGTGGSKPATQAAALATARFAWGGKMDGSSFTQFDGKSYAYSPYRNNIADFYRAAPSFTNTISIKGGGDKGTYRLSLSNLSSDAITRNSDLGRKTVNFSVEEKVTDKLTVNIVANYIDQDNRNPPYMSDGPGNPNNGLFLAPNIKESILAPGYDANGREIVFSDDNYVTNPWFAVNKWVNDVQRKRLISALSAKYDFTKWLYFQAKMGYDHNNDRQLGVTPTGTDYSYKGDKSGDISLNTQQTSELNLDALLGITHKLTSDIGLDFTIGANSRKNNYEYVGISGHPFVIPNLYSPNNVVNYGRGYGSNKRETHSAFYSADFNYKTFLTLSTTGRYDAFSTLYNSGIDKSKRNIFSPSVSASFLFSELLKSSALSFGKLRVSYAQTSGEPTGPYQTATYYGVGGSINGVSTGNYSGSLPNLFLKPYTLKEFEVGAEVKFFHNRLGIDVAYFNRKSTNEIMNAQISIATGFNGSVIANGSIQNKGVEVMVTGNPIKTTDFSWNISFNTTSVKNEVLKTDAANNNLGLGTYRPLNANTAYIVGQAGPQIMANDYKRNSAGQIIIDASGLPEIGGRIASGSVLPKMYGGLKNDFTYRDFNLSFLIDYNFGNKILSATKNYALKRGLDKATLVGRETGIVAAGVQEDGSANTVNATAESYYQRMGDISIGNVLNGDYIKVRQLTLGYTVPEKALSQLPLIRSVQISFVARNLFCLLKHTDNIDPEAAFNTSIGYAGIEGTQLPSTRTLGFNVNLKFK